MTAKTPPAAFDRHALVVARGIADLTARPRAQLVEIVREAIVDAMMMAREHTLLDSLNAASTPARESEASC